MLPIGRMMDYAMRHYQNVWHVPEPQRRAWLTSLTTRFVHQACDATAKRHQQLLRERLLSPLRGLLRIRDSGSAG